MDLAKKAQSLKGQILSCQQAIPQNHPTWGHLELSSNMKTKGGPQYAVSAIFYIGNR